MSDKISAGDVFTVVYPFVKDSSWHAEEGELSGGWRPGVSFEGDEDREPICVAGGEGEMILEVISTHKPGKKYPNRIFYTRKWKDPDGRMFGKASLRIISEKNFKEMIKGYRYQYEIE